MRIAIVAHVRHPIAPPFMGGMEAHSWHLAQSLVKRGHEVTLFASGDSKAGLPAGVSLHATLPEHYDQVYPWHRFHGSEVLTNHIDAGFADTCVALRHGGFDVIHNNSLHRFPLEMSATYGIPMVTSLHIPPFKILRDAVERTGTSWNRFTVTSMRQSDVWWPAGMPTHACVAYNGIALDSWPYCETGDGSAVWAGRITHTKGLHIAVQAALIAGVSLKIYGVIEDEDYFRKHIQPFLGDAIRYMGHTNSVGLARAYAKASVMLFTPMWEEPFGLAAIEGMATGLPVAATKNGAAQEIIGDGGSFATVPSPKNLAQAIVRALEIQPARPRAHVERYFSLDRMLDSYESQYRLACAARPLLGRKVEIRRKEPSLVVP